MTKSSKLFCGVSGLVGLALSCTPVGASPLPVGLTGAPVEAKFSAGALKGVSSDGVESFLGVPFAQPPLGALRWKAPAPSAKWDGVRAADKYGPACPNPRSQDNVSEDCLYLNVQRPAGLKDGDTRPVLVFVHGGSLTAGATNSYDMAPLVRENGVIAVSMGYRLGVLGFLGHPELTKEGGGASGNYGLMDQQLALKWVQDNIAAFGGDPTRVTIQGESAGGWSICGHLLSPGSTGLFQQAIMESGACDPNSLRAIETRGGVIAENVGCDKASDVLACLRATDPNKLVKSGFDTDFLARFAYGTPTLPLPADMALAQGKVNHVPTLLGFNHDEARIFTVAAIGWSKLKYYQWAYDMLMRHADIALEHYPWPENATETTAAELMGAVATDSGGMALIGGCSQIRLTQTLSLQQPVYSFRFDMRDGPGLVSAPNFGTGATHGAELPYLFPSLGGVAPKFNDEQKALATQMKKQWGAFVRTGSPNGDYLPTWPSFNLTGETMALTTPQSHTISLRDLREQSKCDLWDLAGVPARLAIDLSIKAAK